MALDGRNDIGHANGLAVAASLALLGLSLGVNVQELLAAEPPERLESEQAKFGYDSSKWKSAPFKGNRAQQKFDSTQHKLPSVQHKERSLPRMNPMDPPRP